MTTYYRYNGVDYADDDDLPLTLYTKHTRPQLPADLIFKIVREADGGRNAHKKNFAPTLNVIQGVGKYQRHWSNWWEVEEGFFSQYTVSEEINHLIKLSEQPLAWMDANYKFKLRDNRTLDYEWYVCWCDDGAETPPELEYREENWEAFIKGDRSKPNLNL